MRMPSVMPGSHQFSQVPKAQIERSAFDRSFGHKTTFDAGYLIPIYVDEALPGDTFVMQMTAFARLATPLKPVMDNMFLETFFFAVPMRLVWEHFQNFMGERRPDPDSTTEYIIPYMDETAGTAVVGSLGDYMGLPIAVAHRHSALWHRAYNLIYNEWFRDQNLQDSALQKVDDGPDDPTSYPLQRRGKRHDYFTSCLPFPQKGDSVSLPLGTSAPVIGIGSADFAFPGVAAAGVHESDLAARNYPLYQFTGNATSLIVEGTAAVGGYPKIFADLSDATAATINELRQAFQIQRLLERDARGGTRYTELVRSHFRVVSPDGRLQRPEYLGGGSSPVMVSPVAQTSEDGATPQGNLAGIGTVTATGHGFSKSFTEHCLLLGLVSVRADLTYDRGLERMWSRSTRYDFYWPALAHIGEQAVLNKEIWLQGTGADDGVFGYQERFAEYRYKPSKVTGLFRTNAAGSLDVWHLTQEFGALPTLGADFIVENPPIDRVIAVDTEPHFLFDSYMRLKCARPMPVYGVPGLIDHF